MQVLDFTHLLNRLNLKSLVLLAFMTLSGFTINAASVILCCFACAFVFRGQMASSASDLEEQALVLRQICARKQEEVTGGRG